LIDLIVLIKDLTREFAVAFRQRLHRPFERGLGFPAQQEHAIA
jgi:hypothetical protein